MTDDQVAAAEAKFRERNKDDIFLHMSSSFGDDEKFKITLAMDAAMFLCGHPFKNAHELMFLFLLVRHNIIEFQCVFNWLLLFIDEPQL
jgi:hypothetical protein